MIPLDTRSFSGNLDSSITNTQKLAERIDQLTTRNMSKEQFHVSLHATNPKTDPGGEVSYTEYARQPMKADRPARARWQFSRLFRYATGADLKYMPIVIATWIPMFGLLVMALLMQDYIHRRVEFYRILGVEKAMQTVWLVWILYQAASMLAVTWYAILNGY